MPLKGIVRKIDDLGRIVIPKEIRKTLNIRNGEEIEISVSDEKIVLEKYYRLKNLNNNIKDYFFLLEKNLKSDFIITDNEKVLHLSKKLQGSVINSSVSNELYQLISGRKQILENNSKCFRLNNDVVIKKYYYFLPIIINGDSLGSIIIISDEQILEREILIGDIVNQLIKMKLEN